MSQTCLTLLQPDHFYAALAERQDQPGPLQLSLVLPELSVLEWLQGQELYPRWFWTNRHPRSQSSSAHEEIAACGAALTWTDLNVLPQDLKRLPEAMRVYGGWAFRARASYAAPWQHWPQTYFFLPRWELRLQAGQLKLCVNLVAPAPQRQAELQKALAELRAPSPLKSTVPKLQGPYRHQPEWTGWQKMLSSAHQTLAAGTLEKLVLSRSSSIACPELGLEIIQALLQQQRAVYHFWFQPRAGEIFWGASPERLYARRGQQLFSEALAGTRPYTDQPERNQELRQDLLNSSKDRNEHQKVLDFLQSRLHELGSHVQRSPVDVIQAGPVQHLYCRFQADLKPGLTDLDLIAQLHPTPAVNGQPAALAPSYLEALEPHERGWYTGGLGWISAQAAEWAVALRSALWQDHTLHFFTGAGIMPDSNIQSEWQELDAKLVSLESLFQTSAT